MDRRENFGLSDDDRKALREREESTVSVADDARIIQLLVERDGTPTKVHLVDGENLEVLNIAWGYDMDDPYAHVSTNVSPFKDDPQFPFDFFFTYSVVRISDPKDGTTLFERTGA